MIKQEFIKFITQCTKNGFTLKEFALVYNELIKLNKKQELIK